MLDKMMYVDVIVVVVVVVVRRASNPLGLRHISGWLVDGALGAEERRRDLVDDRLWLVWFGGLTKECQRHGRGRRVGIVGAAALEHLARTRHCSGTRWHGLASGVAQARHDAGRTRWW